nr:MAG TPA: hypothetical protein [Bacteriophage sp.]
MVYQSPQQFLLEPVYAHLLKNISKILQIPLFFFVSLFSFEWHLIFSIL